jgi:CHRD domain
MKRFAILTAMAVLAAGCGSSSPNTPSTPPATVTFTAALSPANEVPPVTNADASASGTGTFKMDLTRDSASAITSAKATFIFTVTGFPANTLIQAGHIHTGGPGVIGNPVVNTGLTAGTGISLPSGSVTNQTIANIDVSGTQAQQIIDNPNGFYYNLHTSLNPGGAIRAQLVRQQ